MKVSLDSNLLIYAAHDDDPKHRLAVGVVERAAQGNCVQPLQSLGECFHVLTRKRRFAPDAAMTAVNNFRAIFPIVVADLSVLDMAMSVTRDYKLQFWDALLLATVRSAGCRVLFSEGMNDGQEIAGVKIVNPLMPSGQMVVDLVLPPLES
ncbi:MAG: PIN domain-containing protein [Geminicoccaceae bacterium]